MRCAISRSVASASPELKRRQEHEDPPLAVEGVNSRTCCAPPAGLVPEPRWNCAVTTGRPAGASCPAPARPRRVAEPCLAHLQLASLILARGDPAALRPSQEHCCIYDLARLNCPQRQQGMSFGQN